jgi:hypothetical protein
MPLACACLALLMTAIVLIPLLRAGGWNASALVRVDTATPMGAKAHEIDPHFHTVIGGYDGQFFWGIAIDPFARGDVHQRFDMAAYRYGRPLFGWMGAALSGAQGRAVPAALLAIDLISIAAAAALASLLGRSRGSSGWEGLAVALNPGLLYAATHDLPEPLSAALLLGALLAYGRGRRVWTLALLALLVLSREQYVVVPVALAAWELLRGSRRVRDAALLAATVVPALAWALYVRLQTGDSFTRGSYALSLPLAGWKRTIVDAAAQSYSSDYYQFLAAESNLVVVVALLGLLALAAIRAVRLRGPADSAYLVLTAVALCLANTATFNLRDTLRNLAVLLVLVPFVIVSPPPRPTWMGRRDARSSTATGPSPT